MKQVVDSQHVARKPSQPEAFKMRVGCGARAWLAVMLVLVTGAPGRAYFRGARTPTCGLTSDTQIVVHVYNYAGVSSARLRSAEAETNRIMRTAGIRTLWVDCSNVQENLNPAACARQPNLEILELRILPRSSPANRAFGQTTLGFAEGASLASALYGHIEDLVHTMEWNETEIAPILGHVIAHELGHLLLPSAGHSPTGIMRAQWNQKSLGQLFTGGLLFTAEQSAALRGGVACEQSGAPMAFTTWKQVLPSENAFTVYPVSLEVVGYEQLKSYGKAEALIPEMLEMGVSPLGRMMPFSHSEETSTIR